MSVVIPFPIHRRQSVPKAFTLERPTESGSLTVGDQTALIWEKRGDDQGGEILEIRVADWIEAEELEWLGFQTRDSGSWLAYNAPADTLDRIERALVDYARQPMSAKAF